MSFAAPEEGHSYKVVNGQLVDVAPTPAPAQTSTIIINNNNIVNQPQAQPVPVTPAPEVPVVELPSTQDLETLPLIWREPEATEDRG